MSTDYRTYVGPYVRCAVQQVPATQLQITCLNPQCANHGEGQRTRFCSLCGGKVGTLPHTVLEDAVDDGDLEEQIDERLTTASGDGYWRWSQEAHAHIWLPNGGDEGHHLDDNADWTLTEILPDQIAAELASFALLFAADLVLFQEVYGGDAVTLHWGIIQDYL